MNIISGMQSAYYFLKGITVEKGKGATIIVAGFRTEALIGSIRNHWGTSKISAHMFRKVTSHYLEMDEFFLPDFLYILRTMLQNKTARIARRVVNDLMTALLANTWLADTVSENYPKRFNFNRLDELTWTPLKHQLEFLYHYEEMSARYSLKGYILGAAPGTGKTATCIFKSMICGADIHVYFVPKNSVVDVWRKTLGGIFKKPEQNKAWDSLSGKQLTADYTHYVFHYEQIENAMTFFKKNFVGKKIDVNLDESHNFNEMKSARTQMFIDFCKMVDAQDVLWSSGTPLKAMGSEVIPILHTIDPFFTRFAEERFKQIFGLSSSRALDILQHRLGYMTFKVDKSESVKNEVHTYDVKVKIPNGNDYTLEKVSQDMIKFINERTAFYDKSKRADYEEYHEILKFYSKGLGNHQQTEFATYMRYARILNAGYDPMVHELEAAFCNNYEKKNIIPALGSGDKERFKHLKSIYKYVHLKIKGEALGRVLGKARTQCNVDMLNGWGEYEAVERGVESNKFKTSIHEIIEQAPSKTILFTSYVEVVDKVFDAFTALGARPLRVYGDTNSQLPSILKTFTTDKKANPLAATLKSLSTAVPMIMASDVVFLNTPFRQYEYEQASSRVNRLGQTQVVSLWNVTLDTGDMPNLSTRSNDIMEWSSSMVDAMLGIDATKVADYTMANETAEIYNNQTFEIPSNAAAIDAATDGFRTSTSLPEDVADEVFEIERVVGEEVLASATEATATILKRTSKNPTPGTNLVPGKWTW